MRYVAHASAPAVPHIIVDGAATDGTVLTLSHWPRSGTPAELRADTSTAIVFNYLDRPDLHVEAEAVSNNHFDEDGLVAMHLLLDRDTAARSRRLLVEVAEAGDFTVCGSRRAARIAFAISAYAGPGRSPAIYSRTPCSRVLVVQGRRVELRYRYESWVQVASRRPALRVDLAGLAASLSADDDGGGQWIFEGVTHITPRLYWQRRRPSGLPPDVVRRRVEEQLQHGAPAWDPYA